MTEGEKSDSDEEVKYYLSETGQVKGTKQTHSPVRKGSAVEEAPRGRFVRLAGRQKGLQIEKSQRLDISGLEKHYAPLFQWAGEAEINIPSESISEDESEPPSAQVLSSTPIRRQRTRKSPVADSHTLNSLFEPPPSCFKLREFIKIKPSPVKQRPHLSPKPSTAVLLPTTSSVKRFPTARTERLDRGTVASRQKEVTPQTCRLPKLRSLANSRRQQVTRVIRRLGKSTLARSISANSQTDRGLAKVHHQLQAYLLT